MSIVVERPNGSFDEYPKATGWKADSDGDLQIRQPVPGGDFVALYRDQHWASVRMIVEDS